MEEGDAGRGAGHVDYDLPQRAHLVLAALAVGDVVVLWHQLCILPPLPRQDLAPVRIARNLKL